MGGEKNPETEVERHETVYRGRIVDLEVDRVRLSSGRSVIREVVKHPGGVVAVPVLNDGSLLLIRQFRYPLQKYILEFPAGKLDSGQSLEATILEPAIQTLAMEITASFKKAPRRGR